LIVALALLLDLSPDRPEFAVVDPDALARPAAAQQDALRVLQLEREQCTAAVGAQPSAGGAVPPVPLLRDKLVVQLNERALMRPGDLVQLLLVESEACALGALIYLDAVNRFASQGLLAAGTGFHSGTPRTTGTRAPGLRVARRIVPNSR